MVSQFPQDKGHLFEWLSSKRCFWISSHIIIGTRNLREARSSANPFIMKVSSLLQKFGRDLVYLTIISFLIGWIWVHNKRQSLWNDSITEDLKLAHLIIQGDILNSKMVEINQNAVESPSPQSDDYQKRAQWAQKHTAETLRQYVEQLRADILTVRLDHLERAKRTLTRSELINLNHFAQVLVDTFCTIVDHDPSASGIIKKVLIGDEHHYWLDHLNIDLGQTPAFTHEILLRSEIALVVVLNYCKSKISPGIICDWGFRASIAPQSSYIRLGETYRAEIFTSVYSTRLDNTAFKVNGKILPIKEGIANFSKRYNTLGEKIIKVEMEVKDRRTGKIYTSAKEFSLLVVDSCR